METIISYIENLFRNYPDTPKIRKAKEELLGIMEDKYHELKAQGKSENEAIGVVISEFGNMEEIAFELGEEGKPGSMQSGDAASRESAKEYEEVYPMDLGQAKEYVSWKISFGYYIALGVALCICSPVCACILDALSEGGILSSRFGEMAGALAMFAMVAAGVAIFIIKGIADEGREGKLKRKKVQLDYEAKKYMEQEKEAYMTKFGVFIAIGVVFCIVSVVPVIIIEAFVEGTNFFWLEDVAGAMLFILVAIGVSCFITAGVRQGAYEVVLGEKVLKNPREEENEVMNVVSRIYWLVVTLIYLSWSFFSGAWGTTWVIWPLAGILFGIVAVVVKTITKNSSH